MNLKELKAKYDGKTIGEIEKGAGDDYTLSTEARRNFIQVLFYLQQTERFRQNKKYKEVGFTYYLRDRWNLTLTAYYREKFVFLNFPAEAERHGVGTVARIHRKCKAGVEGTKKVLDLIDKEEKKAKKPLPAAKVDKIINKFEDKAPAKPPITKVCLSCETLKKELFAANKTIREQADQIEKLKATIRNFKEDKNFVDGLMTLIHKAPSGSPAPLTV
jgi:hypothetical protein